MIAHAMVAKVARFVAPIALAAVALGIYLIVDAGLATHSHRAATSTSALTPRPSPARRSLIPAKLYVVRPGDTLSAIAVRTHVPLPRLLSLNPAVSPNSLQTGQRLRLRR